MKYSYILGVISLALSLVIRVVDVVVSNLEHEIPTKGDGIGYRAFMNGAFLFFVTAIASACYTWVNSQRTQPLQNNNAWNRRVNDRTDMSQSS